MVGDVPFHGERISVPLAAIVIEVHTCSGKGNSFVVAVTRQVSSTWMPGSDHRLLEAKASSSFEEMDG